MASAKVPRYDRSWVPVKAQEHEYFSKTNRDTKPHHVDTSLPAGLPKVVESKTAWSGAEVRLDPSSDKYTFVLEDVDIGELEEACRNFQELGLALDYVSQRTFPLPTLSTKLKAWASELTSGVGFFRIRGLDPQRYSSDTNILLYLGVCSYVGEKRGVQDEHGNMLLHLTDVGPAAAPLKERQAPYSNISQPFHTDAGDILALYALGEAQTGGNCQLVSQATVYNEIAAARPDIIRLLASPTWIFDSFGLDPAFTVRPLLFPIRDGKILFSFSRRPLVGSAQSPRTDGVPDLSDAHIEAINAVQFVADKHALSTKLKRGEMLIWNNLCMLHSREGFTDGGPGQKRHLVRLWLRNEASARGWPIPEEIRPAWDDAFADDGRTQKWPLAPITDRE